jgi:hypothetical protein
MDCIISKNRDKKINMSRVPVADDPDYLFVVQ